jgi:hypothetical protein
MHPEEFTHRGQRTAIGVEPNRFCGLCLIKPTSPWLHPGSPKQPSNRAAMDLKTLGKVSDPSATLIGENQIRHRSRFESPLDLPHRALNQHSLTGPTIIMTGQIRQRGV